MATRTRPRLGTQLRTGLAGHTPAGPVDLDALRSPTVRIVPAIGAQWEGTLARRGGEALAKKLGREPVVFPGDHGGFAKGPMSPDNDPAAFAAKLREVLDET